jgi:hypothetical protein
MVIVERRKLADEELYEVRQFGNKVAVGVNFGTYNSMAELLQEGFGGLLKEAEIANMKDHLEIKGFYKLDAEDAMERHFE